MNYVAAVCYRHACRIAALLVLVQCELAHAASLEMTFQEGTGAMLPNVALFIDGQDARISTGDSSDAPVFIYQRDKRFYPYVQIAGIGQTVQFLNDDNITHHVYTLTGDEKFSFRLKKKAPSDTYRFTRPEIFAMGCNVHDWMSGYLLVTDSKYTAISDHAGRVTINLPEGHYSVRYWHPAFGYKDGGELGIEGKTSKIVRFTEKISARDPQENLNEFDFLQDY